jgi:Beta-lactamase enzyme family
LSHRGRGKRSRAPTGHRRAVPALVGACVAAAVIVGASLAFGGSGSDTAAQGSASTRAPGAPSTRPASATRGSAASAKPPVTAKARTPAGSHRDPFGTTAAAYLSARVGTILAAVYDVGTGQAWHLGQGRPQDEASVVKLDVLETLLGELHASSARSDTGLSASDRWLTQQMIEDSDNDAATSLWYQVGGAPKIGAFNAAAGLADTSPSSCVNCPGFPWPGWGLTTTTPADQLILLKNLVEPSSLLTDADRSYALSLMENVTPSQRWGVSGGVPPQVTVALKNGWLPLDNAGTDWQVNSVGWVSGQGRNYLMAVLTTGNPGEQYGIDTIDQLAAIVWQDMR